MKLKFVYFKKKLLSSIEKMISTVEERNEIEKLINDYETVDELASIIQRII